MAQYAWNRRPKGAPKATIAGNYIASLNRKHKGISAEQLVEECRDAESPLHRCFEWNNPRAADEYRKAQARLVLRSLVVVIQESDDVEPVQVNAFVTFDDQPEYVAIQSVVSDEDLDAKYKRALLDDLKSIKNKCQQYSEFGQVCKAIDRIRIR